MDSTGCESKIKCAPRPAGFSPEKAFWVRQEHLPIVLAGDFELVELLGRGCSYTYIYDVGGYRGKVRKLFLKRQEILSI